MKTIAKNLVVEKKKRKKKREKRALMEESTRQRVSIAPMKVKQRNLLEKYIFR